jgi:hypothetical protein
LIGLHALASLENDIKGSHIRLLSLFAEMKMSRTSPTKESKSGAGLFQMSYKEAFFAFTFLQGIKKQNRKQFTKL